MAVAEIILRARDEASSDIRKVASELRRALLMVAAAIEKKYGTEGGA